MLSGMNIEKKKKDPGIPNSFPYKEQILAELSESRRLVGIFEYLLKES